MITSIAIQKEELVKALKFVYKSVPSNPQLPALSSILFSLRDGRLSLSSTDLYFGIQSTITASSTKNLITAVPGSLFKEVIMSLDDDLIKIQFEENSLVIKSNGGTMKIPTQDPDEFPEFPKISTKKISLSTLVIKEIEEFVCFAAGVDQARPVLTTLLLSISNNKLKAVATDGFRLSVLELSEQLSESVEDQEILIPAKYFSEIYQIALTHQVNEVEFFIENSLKQIMVKIGDNNVYVRQIEGEYPPYEKIIPTESAFTSNLEIDRENLLKEIKRAAIFSKQESGVVSLEIKNMDKKGEVVVQSASSSRGSYHGIVLIEKGGGMDIKIAFNADYLKEFLSIGKTEIISIHTTEELKPAVFKMVGKDNLKYVAMPFRINQ